LLGTSITADGTQIYQLPPGPCRVAITTATGVYAALTRIPL
jgi:hypothetical protein